MLTYNHFHKILRLCDILLNFPFTTDETKRDYTNKQYIRAASRVAKRPKA